uniref:Uncharacterized protein n=1 Tax=Clastoptera arizonana TaxID=38151 RepID=A0A1B6DAB0_9HEMI
MVLLENCFCCSLAVAASVIGIYTLVAYIIAFLMEVWWIVQTEAKLPSPAYVLCAGYFLVFILSAVLLRGLSVKKTLYLLEWLLVIAAFSFPEAILVLFMSIHYWKVRSLYGLTELTCWVCRAVVNVAGMICVQSLYSTWREEKQVLRRLRDLNTASTLPNRRNSVSGNGHIKNALAYQNSGFSGSCSQLNNGAIVTNLRSPVAQIHLSPGVQMFGNGVPQPLIQRPLFLQDGLFYNDNVLLNGTLTNSEFNASTFNLALSSNHNNSNISRTQSMMDLRLFSNSFENPRKAMSVIDGNSVENTNPKLFTQSLDRRILKSHGYEDEKLSKMELNTLGDGRLRNAYFSPDFPFYPRKLSMQIAQNPQFYIYNRNINSSYNGNPKTRSKISLGAESDDFQKYRDVAL